MSQNNVNVESKRVYCLNSKQEYEAYKKRQDKQNLNFVKPDFSKLFGDAF
jgi:hypothetical protein